MKDEYMKILEEKLSQYKEETRKEILEDYEAHFAEGRAAGRSDEEIIRELGDIQEMLDEIPSTDLNREEKEKAEVGMFTQENYQDNFYQGIEVETSSIDIVVDNATDDQIYVDYQGPNPEECEGRYKFYQYEKDGIFYVGVAEEEGSAGLHFGRHAFFQWGKKSHTITGGKLIIKVPSRVPSLQIKTNSGDIQVTGLTKQSIKSKATSGDFVLQDCKAEKIMIQSTSGDLHVQKIVGEIVSLQSTSGDVEIRQLTAQELNLQSTSGDVNGEDIVAEKLTGQSASGDMEVFANAKEVSFQTSSGDVEAKLSGEPVAVRAGTGSGDVEIELLAVEAGPVSVNTGSGDIEIYVSRQRVICEGHMARFQGNGNTSIQVQTGSGDCSITSK